MNDLQRLFKARGITMQTLGRVLGLNWHAVQKNVKGTRQNQHIREAVAAFLGLTVAQVFGPRSAVHLRPLIEREIFRKRQEYERTLKVRFLDNHHNITTVPAGRRMVNG